MAKKNGNKSLMVLGIVIGLLMLGFYNKSPFFLGAITGFTVGGGEIRFTDETLVNESGDVIRYYEQTHPNVTLAYLDIFGTPTISNVTVTIDGGVYNVLTQGSFENVIRLFITPSLQNSNCYECVVEFVFHSDTVGSIIVTELNVEYGDDPSIWNEASTPTQQTSDSSSDTTSGNDVSVPSSQVIEGGDASDNTKTIVIVAVVGIIAAMAIFDPLGKRRGKK